MAKRKQVHVCDRCQAASPAGTELQCEIWFGNHVCAGLPELGELPLDLLRELAYGRMTEAQAWEQMKVRGVQS